ncbi:hypothetical protein PCANC_21098 [Puccinia coronata f. sp. avenae]|uniref:Uncharacterized protein n=1 Tax=Puccinia coronata f. sp. avenae TaxID=200324 RepID=A0A2N5TX91_9BASI|nr:hypothetical protein PCANC_21098 [Puccinia coronata f. sp. avenae]
MAGGESVPNPPPPASSGSAPSPSISYRADPTQHRRNPIAWTLTPVLPTTLPLHHGRHTPVFPMDLPLAALSTLPCQAPHVHSLQHKVRLPCRNSRNIIISITWAAVAVIGKTVPAPNTPHFVPGNPPMNANMPNYPIPNGSMASNHGGNPSQYLPKPPPFSHRNGLGGQSAGSSSTIYPPSSGRSNLHHQPRNSAAGPPVLECRPAMLLMVVKAPVISILRMARECLHRTGPKAPLTHKMAQVHIHRMDITLTLCQHTPIPIISHLLNMASINPSAFQSDRAISPPSSRTRPILFSTRSPAEFFARPSNAPASSTHSCISGPL